MNHYLGRLAQGNRQWIIIDALQYATIRDHKVNLIRGLEIEERFDILLGNYREFEEDILTMALRHAVIPAQQPNDYHTQRRELNRRIANFLSSARLYIDHLKHNLSTIYGDGSSQATTIKAQLSQHYDKSISYRLMEALRNHVQHRGLAAPLLSVNFSLTELRPGAQEACTVTPQMMKRYLLEDSMLTAKIRAEIEQLPETVDLKPHVRGYMGCLSAVNDEVRKLLETDNAVWEATIRQAIDRFKQEFNIPDDASTVGLAIFQVDGEMPSPVKEKHDVFIDFIEYRKYLTTVNRVTDKLDSHFATGQQQDLMKAR